MTAGALAARARGLSTHLIDDDDLEVIGRAGDRPGLVAALARVGFAAGALGGGDPSRVEAAIRARDRAERALIDRWAVDQPAVVSVLADDDDRRTLRAVIRGVVAGAPSTARITGAVPTASLPEPALTALAAATSPAEIAAVLARHRHPAADVLTPLLAPPVELLAIELALSRWFAARATRHGDDRALAVHVAQLIDVDNVVAALLLSARGRELDASVHFLDGGARLDRSRFIAAAAAQAAATPATLKPAFGGTPLATALDPEAAIQPDAVERAALDWHLASQTALRRSEPLGLAPLLWLMIRRRIEGGRLRRAAWRVAMMGAS